MFKFEIDREVFKALPDYVVAFLVFEIDHNDSSLLGNRLNEEVKAFYDRYHDCNVREISNIKLYRDAFYQLDMNPNKYMCSIEALAKRVAKGNGLPAINFLVDMGNLFSLRHCLALGAHDIDQMEDGGLMIRFSKTDDHFLPLAETEVERMPEHELVYVSGHTVKTRRWIWRQSEDGKLTEASRRIFMPIDGFKMNLEEVEKAQMDIAAFLKETCGIEVTLGLVDQTNPTFHL